jgi:hypothetical protein
MTLRIIGNLAKQNIINLKPDGCPWSLARLGEPEDSTPVRRQQLERLSK